MAGLGEVCSHVGAILFYIEAVRCAKTCTDVTCQWVVPTSVKSIPYAKIADIDFTRPKSKLIPLKQAAHHNNDCDMLSDETDIENRGSSCHSNSGTVPTTHSSGTVNANLTEPSKDHINAFFSSISKHKSCCLSLVSPYSSEFVPKSQIVIASLPPLLTRLYSAQNEELTYNELMNHYEGVAISLNRQEILEIEKATREQSHCDAWYAQLSGRSLSKDHLYYYQVQTQLFVSGAEFADFVVCTFPNNIPTLSVERISLDEEFVDACIEQASQIFKVAILPELLGRWYSRSLVIPVKMNSENSGYDYCYCKEELGGEMICCDNSDCKSGQWFHLSCLNLKTSPHVKKWYCPTCRRQEELKSPRRKKQKAC